MVILNSQPWVGQKNPASAANALDLPRQNTAVCLRRPDPTDQSTGAKTPSSISTTGQVPTNGSDRGFARFILTR